MRTHIDKKRSAPGTPPGSPSHPTFLRPSSSDYFGDSEEGREFLQRRLKLSAQVMLSLSGGFFVISTILDRMGGVPVLERFQHLDNVFHFATILILVGLWLFTRYGHRSTQALAAIDATTMLTLCLGYAFMSAAATTDRGLPMILAAVLATAHTLLGRAMVVPCAASRTFAIGIAGSIPIVVMAVYVQKSLGGSLVVAGYAATWCAVAIGSSTFASHVVYGLRREVREAQRLGQYTLLEKLGEGGMGEVYKASHSMLRRPTAIKLLPPARAGEHNLLRFEREVQLTSRLTNPSTIAIYDYGRTPDGIFYYAMEYLDGLTLGDLVAHYGPIAAARVVPILQQVCASLGEAHDIGLIHRDIKPANIILCERAGVLDLAKVVDFGLVKDLESREPALTVSGEDRITGTPLYLSPEAITSPDKVDGRSDLYALGAVGYFLLTGEHVFTGKTLIEICSHHLHTRPVHPAERLGAPLPDDLSDLVLRCLEKDPALRPQKAMELFDLLAGCKQVGTWTTEQARAWWCGERSRDRSLLPGDDEDDDGTGSTSAADLGKSSIETCAAMTRAALTRTIGVDLRRR